MSNKRFILMLILSFFNISYFFSQTINKNILFHTNKNIVPDSVYISSDNKFVLISDSGGASLFNLETGDKIRTYQTNKNVVPDSVAISSDNKFVLISDSGGASLYFIK